jgi:hypothetical protein
MTGLELEEHFESILSELRRLLWEKFELSMGEWPDPQFPVVVMVAFPVQDLELLEAGGFLRSVWNELEVTYVLHPPIITVKEFCRRIEAGMYEQKPDVLPEEEERNLSHGTDGHHHFDPGLPGQETKKFRGSRDNQG